MGIQQALGYEVGEPNVAHRALRAFAATRFGARLLSLFLARVDKLVFKLSRGRTTATSILTGLPVVMLTTTGSRSGQQRSQPVLGLPSGDGLAVQSGNFGQQTLPAWVGNLDADPSATIGYRGRSVAVTARRADPAEVEATLTEAVSIYSGLSAYRERIHPREIDVFLLVQADQLG